MTMDVRTALEYLKSKVDSGDVCGTCLLYNGFNRECSPCPFTNCMVDESHGTCGLRSIRTVLQKIADREVSSCVQEDTLKGTQQDCLKSLLRRIQNLERQQKADSSFIYQSDHQLIKANEVGLNAVIRDMNDKSAIIKAQSDELQRIRDHLFAIGKKGK